MRYICELEIGDNNKPYTQQGTGRCYVRDNRYSRASHARENLLGHYRVSKRNTTIKLNALNQLECNPLILEWSFTLIE